MARRSKKETKSIFTLEPYFLSKYFSRLHSSKAHAFPRFNVIYIFYLLLLTLATFWLVFSPALLLRHLTLSSFSSSSSSFYSGICVGTRFPPLRFRAPPSGNLCFASFRSSATVSTRSRGSDACTFLIPWHLLALGYLLYKSGRNILYVAQVS